MRTNSFKAYSKVVLLAVFLMGSACQSAGDQTAQEGEPMKQIQITSSAFEEAGTIPVKYSCDGEGISPPLEWSGVPNQAQSLALIADDPDAPVGTFVHWVVYNMEPGLTNLPEGVALYAPDDYQDTGAIGIEGKNGSGNEGYRGPCPPGNSAHRYFFKLYALDTRLDLQAGATKKQLESAMQGKIVAQGQLMGKYSRSR